MDNNDIEQLITLKGERFFQHIEEHYGKLVEKILRYHDIDSYTILSQVDQQEMINLFEKPNHENYSITLKFGTKNKIILLLKSTRDIIKRKKLQLAYSTRSNQFDIYRLSSSSSSSSSSSYNSASDCEASFEQYLTCLKESLEQLLNKLNKKIHGTICANVTSNDFKIFIENTSDSIIPICFMQSICGDRTKLYLRNRRFQLSNFGKHLNLIKNVSTPFTNNSSEEPDDRATDLHQTDSNDQILRTETNQSINKNDSNICENSGNINKSTAASSKIKYNGNMSDDTLPKQGETQSSISFTSSIKSKKQLSTNQQRQTTDSTSKYQRSDSSQGYKLQENSSQPKKRKLDEDEKRSESYSLKKNSITLSKKNVSHSNIDNSDILCALLNTIDFNKHRSANNYRCPKSVLRFAAGLFILAGSYVYEYIRINFKFLLPSIETVKNCYKINPYSEAEFRFDESKIYLDSIDCQSAFLSEDCSAFIPRIEYDSTLNCFNSFVTPIDGGKPIENAFDCQSFEELKRALETQPRANLVNVHVLQPITDASFSRTPPPAVLSAYGTDNKISSIDILKRWLIIFAEFHSRNIHVLGFSTDGDPKYLRTMRLTSNFFVRTQTLTIYNDTLYFTINIPNWPWYFLNPDQIFLFMQDGTYLCTKTRNRLLSQNANLKMGTYKVSTKHLYNLINTKNKMDHNLSKSDLNVRDKQNFSSCQRISDDKVFNLLLLSDHCKATYSYLLVLNLLILAYTQSKVSLLNRIYYAWVVLFFIRLWRIWLYITKRTRKSRIKNSNKNEQYCFITSNALLSIELNAHYLIYTYLLIEQKLIPQYVAKFMHLFSSQPCESLFRDARALFGVYTTRINFTMKQLLQRINKLNALTEIRQCEEVNHHEQIRFPVHHKIKRLFNEANQNDNDEDADFNANNIEVTISQAYEAAQQMVTFVGMDKNLIKNHLFEIEESSQMAEKLLNLNTLTESEIIILDSRDNEDSDEEVVDEGGDEDILYEASDGEGCNEDDDKNDGVDDCLEDHTESDYENNINENSFKKSDYAEDGDVEDCIDDDIIGSSNENIHDCCSSDEDLQPTSSFENLQTTSYSGIS
ncbi:unnamed protein product [Rotaria socialis]|uniref:Uncharacterized protein n=1 Tax=Rotaria socialis TaxID=392032 RepID=A0A818I2G0_9BILA|nr:unnamed protein product [Rotaria socialis]